MQADDRRGCPARRARLFKQLQPGATDAPRLDGCRVRRRWGDVAPRAPRAPRTQPCLCPSASPPLPAARVFLSL